MSKKNEKMDAKELAKELLNDRTHGAAKVGAKELEKAGKFCEGYKSFMDAAKTEREAVSWAVKAAEDAGFIPFDPKKAYKAGDKVYYNNRGKAMCLAVIGKKGAKEGVRIAAAHVDNPRIDLKPIPLYESNELAMMKTHYYGGIKKYQWTAIPLALHGKIIRKDGQEITVRVGEKEGEPQFTITDLLPHLAKDQVSKRLGEAFTGEDLNVLVGSRPLEDAEGEQLFKLNVMKILNEKYGIVESDLISAELSFVPAFKAVDIGFDRSMVGAYGHDDRVCAYPILEAIFKCKTHEYTCISVLADKEEIGSDGVSGMQSQAFDTFIADLCEGQGVSLRECLEHSFCLSADVTACYDPNFASVYDKRNSSLINRGVGLCKYTGSRGKAGASDASAEVMGYIRGVLDQAGVLWHVAELGKVDVGGGGTVAVYMANRNIDTVDAGVSVLGMHAPFEVTGKLDCYMSYRSMKAVFEQ